MGGDPAGQNRSGPIRTYMWCSPCWSEHDPECSFLLGTKGKSLYDPRQIALRDRIRALTPHLDARERALFGLVWLQLDILDAETNQAADWTLSVLETVVAAFEQGGGTHPTEPP